MSRLVVVTGAASGIGAAVRRLLEERGDRVLGVDLEGTEVIADLATAAGRDAAVAAVLEQSGGAVDGVVTCAGLSGVAPALPHVNFFGTTELVAGLRGALSASRAPRVVVIGSISATQPVDQPLVDALLAADVAAVTAATAAALADRRPQQLYPSSKSALAQWARRTAVSAGWADAGIPVNVVAPGVVLTPMSEALFGDPRMKKVMDAAVPMPLHGYSAPEDVARVIGFLLSPETTHVTGQVLYVDGGAEATLRGSTHF
ncbi:SDR family oxidoreductase [Nocardioides sp. YIM 152315]|uniref:SDR family oxidoreductase n=1 Tax=Nocardioides sp. YIM 152315 TaxID=3031760 RepID=UPI0023DCBB36|nr:SDR family oxidoreductase [Nocardioides sp. YIM 152315]MDF1604116.1 SDR family oxidoreductase [Nocardioides sp. YIM 152315]